VIYDAIFDDESLASLVSNVLPKKNVQLARREIAACNNLWVCHIEMNNGSAMSSVWSMNQFAFCRIVVFRSCWTALCCWRVEV